MTRETLGTAYLWRVAPTPRPPEEERFALLGFPVSAKRRLRQRAADRREGLANQDSGTPPLKLPCVWMAGVLA